MGGGLGATSLGCTENMSTRLKILLTVLITGICYSQNLSTDTSYNFSMGVREYKGHYYHDIAVAMYYKNKIVDGDLTKYNAHELFFGYNPKILEVDSLYFIPLQVGETEVYLRNPYNPTKVADSISIVVSKQANKLILKTRR